MENFIFVQCKGNVFDGDGDNGGQFLGGKEIMEGYSKWEN